MSSSNPSPAAVLWGALATAWRVVTFQSSCDELRGLDRRHVMLGLVLTWLVGIGRWWEDPHAEWLVRLGLGSVVYVFVLAAFLWLLLWPLNAPHWRFTNVLAFIALTSPPAILYALPVRHCLELESAQTARLLMLGVVAGWRVALLGWYLGRGAGFRSARRLVALVFPLLFIIFTLVQLNLERAVFELMRGLDRSRETVNDNAYAALFVFSLFSLIAFLPTAIAYVLFAAAGVKERMGPRAGWVLYSLTAALLLVGGVLYGCRIEPGGTILLECGVVLGIAAWVSQANDADSP